MTHHDAPKTALPHQKIHHNFRKMKQTDVAKGLAGPVRLPRLSDRAWHRWRNRCSAHCLSRSLCTQRFGRTRPAREFRGGLTGPASPFASTIRISAGFFFFTASNAYHFSAQNCDAQGPVGLGRLPRLSDRAWHRWRNRCLSSFTTRTSCTQRFSPTRPAREFRGGLTGPTRPPLRTYK
jgi:hypothetical protein